jgi:hypothetical protein
MALTTTTHLDSRFATNAMGKAGSRLDSIAQNVFRDGEPACPPKPQLVQVGRRSRKSTRTQMGQQAGLWIS